MWYNAIQIWQLYITWFKVNSVYIHVLTDCAWCVPRSRAAGEWQQVGLGERHEDHPHPEARAGRGGPTGSRPGNQTCFVVVLILTFEHQSLWNCKDNWGINNQFVRPCDMTFSPTKCGKLLNIISLISFGPIRILNILCFAGYPHIHFLTWLAFPHLSEQQTSIKAFCRYGISHWF